MSELLRSSWRSLILILGMWIVYVMLRPKRDYYVLQRHYYNRIHAPPKPLGRGELFSAHYEGFDDYLPAKATFDLNEGRYMQVLDDAGQEAEHSLFVVPARSKAGAIVRLKAGRAHDKQLVNSTPFTKILERRAFWEREIREQKAFEQEQAAEQGGSDPHDSVR